MHEKPRKRLIREDFVNALSEMNTFIDITVEDLMELNARAEKHARLRATKALTVASLMSQPVETVHPDCALTDAAHLLITRKISGLPVVDTYQKLVGVITEADFLRALGVPTHPPSYNLWQTLEAMFSHHNELVEPDETVSDLMVKDVITVAPEHTLQHVLEVMKRHKIKRVIVCNEDQDVVGIVTRSDLVRVFFDRIRGLEIKQE